MLRAGQQGHRCPNFVTPHPAAPFGRRHSKFLWQQIKKSTSGRRRAGRSSDLRLRAVSLPRNWQAFKMNVKYTVVDWQDQFWSLPYVAAVVQRLQQIQRPVAAAILRATTTISRWWQTVTYEYDQFSTAEITREWKWRRKHEQEWDLWRRIVLGLTCVFFTVVWEAIVPTSLFWALVPPLWLAWSLYDNWIASPFMLGLLIMLPLKFPPYGPIRVF